MSVADHQSATLLIPLTASGIKVLLYLCFKGLGEHPPRSLPSDLVQVEQCSFMDLLILM